MHHSGQAQSRAAVRGLAVIIFGLAGLSGFAGTGWSQTVVNTVCDLEAINNNPAGNYVLGRDVDASDFSCNANMNLILRR